MNFKTELISFRVAPRSRRDLTHSLWPHREAYISAVNEAWKGKVQREKLHIHHHRDRSQHLHQEVTADSRDVHILLPKLVLCDHPMGKSNEQTNSKKKQTASISSTEIVVAALRTLSRSEYFPIFAASAAME
jgi:hypothetical protein